MKNARYTKNCHSIHFTCSVVSSSSQSHELQHARLPCPSPTAEVYPNSCPLSRWCHPNISSSVVLFSSCLQSFPASGSFQMSQLFASDGQNTGVGCHSLLQRIFLTQGLKLGLPLCWQILYCLSHQVCPLTNFYIYTLFLKKWSLSSQL